LAQVTISWTVLGATAALASNAAWIVGSTLFSKVLKGASPFGINLGRGLLTLAQPCPENRAAQSLLKTP